MRVLFFFVLFFLMPQGVWASGVGRVIHVLDKLGGMRVVPAPTRVLALEGVLPDRIIIHPEREMTGDCKGIKQEEYFPVRATRPYFLHLPPGVSLSFRQQIGDVAIENPYELSIGRISVGGSVNVGLPNLDQEHFSARVTGDAWVTASAINVRAVDVSLLGGAFYAGSGYIGALTGLVEGGALCQVSSAVEVDYAEVDVDPSSTCCAGSLGMIYSEGDD